MKKKAISITVSAILCASLLSACGNSSSESASSAGSSSAPAATTAASAQTAESAATEASSAASTASADTSGEQVNLIAAWWGNQVRNDRTSQVLQMYSDAHPNVTFDAQPGQWDDYFTKLATAATGDSFPDFLQTPYNAQLQGFVDSDLLLDLTPYTQSGALNVSNIDQGILDSGTVNGKLVAICAGVNAPALIYNKTLTDSLGIEIKPNMTIDEFESVSKEIYEKTGVKTDLAYGNAESMMTYILRGKGISNIFGDKKLSVDSADAFNPFFEVYETGYKEGWMLGAEVYASLTLNSVEQCPLIYYSSPETQSWCACFWSNQLTALQSAAPDGVELAYSNWPARDPAKADFLHPSQFFSVSSKTKYPDVAVDFLNYIINDVDANKVLLAERGIPAPSDVAEAISPLLSDENQKEITFINEVVTPNSSTISPLPPQSGTEIYDNANNLIEQILYGKITAQDASQQFYDQANTILAR